MKGVGSMSREARQLSNTGIYHITFRGMNHCHNFEEESDYLEFFKTCKI